MRVGLSAELDTRYPYDEERTEGDIEQETHNCHSGRGDDALTIANVCSWPIAVRA
jgi:hypothetical protein